jgi:hypothetical protein
MINIGKTQPGKFGIEPSSEKMIKSVTEQRIPAPHNVGAVHILVHPN